MFLHLLKHCICGPKIMGTHKIITCIASLWDAKLLWIKASVKWLYFLRFGFKRNHLFYLKWNKHDLYSPFFPALFPLKIPPPPRNILSDPSTAFRNGKWTVLTVSFDLQKKLCLLLWCTAWRKAWLTLMKWP